MTLEAGTHIVKILLRGKDQQYSCSIHSEQALSAAEVSYSHRNL